MVKCFFLLENIAHTNVQSFHLSSNSKVHLSQDFLHNPTIHENSLELPEKPLSTNNPLRANDGGGKSVSLVVATNDESVSVRVVRKSLAHESGSRFGDNSRRRRSYVSVDPSPPTPRKKENSCIVNSGWDLL